MVVFSGAKFGNRSSSKLEGDLLRQPSGVVVREIRQKFPKLFFRKLIDIL